MNAGRWITRCVLGSVAVFAQGCGGPAYQYDAVVTGTVTIDGDLAKSGTVTFHPVKEGKPAIGRIHPDGSYSLRTGQGDLKKEDGGTVMSGEYLVTVNITGPASESAVVAEGGPPIPGPSLIHSKYSQKSTTDLRYTVEPGPQVIVLNLAGPEPAPPAEESPKETPEAASSEQVPSAESAGGEADQPQPPPGNDAQPGEAAEQVESPSAATGPNSAAPENPQSEPEKQAP
jgi:hypothetical protein